MFILRVIAPIIVLSLVSCSDGDRYEISKDAIGRTVRLDKKTGEVAILEGSQLQVLKDPRKPVVDKKELEKLASPRYWPTTENSNLNAAMELKTAWLDGEMFYSFHILHLAQHMAMQEYLNAKSGTDLERKAKAKLDSISTESVSVQLNRTSRFAPFALSFYDEHGTMLRTVKINADQFINVVNDKGQTLSFRHESSISLSNELYSQLKKFTVQWYGK